GGLIQMADGAFYGTTKQGGLKNNGTIFRLEPAGTLNVIKSLGVVSRDIMQPEGTLLSASDGMLYGTCALGGNTGNGGVFRVAPDGSRFEVVHHFGMTVDGARQPNAGLIEVAAGSLLGTSFSGGAKDLGAIFKLDKDGRNYQTLHSFAGGPTDGVRSRAKLTQGLPGIFYSTTLSGGSTGLGTIFQLTVPELGDSAARR
ncbi:MAG: choice-of-anchor tandem repeat GloVer-containing protein, partial [Verrucomicrobiota bacterium]